MEHTVSTEIIEAFVGLMDTLVTNSLRRVLKPQEEMGSSKGLLNRKAAATYLSVSPPTIDRLLGAGEIKVVEIPGTTAKRYAIRSLDNFIKRHAKSPKSGGG